MTVTRKSTESTEEVQARLCARFPGRKAEVVRQVGLAIACADHLSITMTPDLLDRLVTEHLRAKIASRPAPFRASPAVPMVHRSAATRHAS
jgi:hypothetical protein